MRKKIGALTIGFLVWLALMTTFFLLIAKLLHRPVFDLLAEAVVGTVLAMTYGIPPSYVVIGWNLLALVMGIIAVTVTLILWPRLPMPRQRTPKEEFILEDAILRRIDFELDRVRVNPKAPTPTLDWVIDDMTNDN